MSSPLGRDGGIIHFDGLTWSVMDSGVAKMLTAVSGTGPNDVWAVGEGGVIIHFDGNSWTEIETPGISSTFFSVHVNGANDLYLVGRGDRLYHYLDGAWDVTRLPVSTEHRSVYPFGGNVYVGGVPSQNEFSLVRQVTTTP